MNELLTYIKKQNAETKAWVDAEPGRWAGYIPEDMDFWAKRNVFTVRDYEMDEMLSTISDLAKDAYGTRSACPDVSGMSYEELSVVYDRMVDAVNAAAVAEQEGEKKRIEAFEKLVANTIELGAGNRETAIKWLMDAENDSYIDNDYFCYKYGIPYGYLDKAA